MPSENKTAVVIVTYNTPVLLLPQLECFRRFCRDDFEVVIVDNSTDKEAAAAIKYHADGCRYIRTHAGARGGSSSHAFAANIGLYKIREDYRYYFFADFDLFPVKPFSVVEILDGKVIAGIGQEKSKTYFWPGCLMFDLEKEAAIDFSCNEEHRLDTGGNLYKVIEKHGPENCQFFGEEYFENEHFRCSNPKYNHYTVIAETFMHFIGASGWEGVERNEERLNSLLNILKERTG